MKSKTDFKYKVLCIRFISSVKYCRKFLSNERYAYLFKNYTSYCIDEWLLTVKQKKMIIEMMNCFNELTEYLNDEEKQRLIELGGQL